VRKAEGARSRPRSQRGPRRIPSYEALGPACFESLLDRKISFGLHGDSLQAVFPPR